MNVIVIIALISLKTATRKLVMMMTCWWSALMVQKDQAVFQLTPSQMVHA